MKAGKEKLDAISTNLNLISALTSLSANTEKTMDFSSYNHKELQTTKFHS